MSGLTQPCWMSIFFCFVLASSISSLPICVARTSSDAHQFCIALSRSNDVFLLFQATATWIMDIFTFASIMMVAHSADDASYPNQTMQFFCLLSLLLDAVDQTAPEHHQFCAMHKEILVSGSCAWITYLIIPIFFSFFFSFDAITK